MPYYVRNILKIVIGAFIIAITMGASAHATGEAYYWGDEDRTTIIGTGGVYADGISSSFTLGKSTGYDINTDIGAQYGVILELENMPESAIADGKLKNLDCRMILTYFASKEGSKAEITAYPTACRDDSEGVGSYGKYQQKIIEAVGEGKTSFSVGSNFCYSSFSSNTLRAACVYGAESKNDYSRCIAKSVFSGDLTAQRNACWKGQELNEIEGGDTTGSACAKLYDFSMITSDESVRSAVSACINGAQNPDDEGFCKGIYYESRLADRKAACEKGQDIDSTETDDKEEDDPYKDTSPPDSDSDATTSCSIDGIGWIICPVVNFMAAVTDASYGVLTVLLETPASMFDRSEDAGKAAYAAWGVMRNIANIAFVIAFIIIVYSQFTGVGITNYGIKKMLPRLVVAAILVNLSFFICALAVDLSNVSGSSLKGVIDSISNSIDATIANSSGETSEIKTIAEVEASKPLDGSNIWGNLAGSVLVVGGLVVFSLYAGLTVFLPILISALAAVVTVVVVLTMRQALVILLIVIAPLAFVAYLLPNTEGWFKKWRSLLGTLLLMFPIIAVIFGVSSLAGKIVMLSSSNILVQIMGAGITLIPLFITPVVMKAAGGVLNRFAGVVNNRDKGVFDRMRKGAASARQNSAYVRGREGRRQLRQARKNRKSAAQYKQGQDIAAAIADDKTTENLTTKADGTKFSAVEVAQRAAALRAYHAARGPSAAIDAGIGALSKKALDSSIPGVQAIGAAGVFTHGLTGAAGREEDRDELGKHYEAQVERAAAEALKDAASLFAKELAAHKARGGDQDKFLDQAIRGRSGVDQEAALHTAASLGRSGVVADAKGHVDEEMRQRAISSNAGALLNKAPDLVKGEGAAFKDVSGKQLAGFSADTMKRYTDYLAQEATAGNTEAVLSLQSAIKDIQSDPTLQLEGNSGRTLKSGITDNVQLAGVAGSAASMIGGDGKIRDAGPSTQEINFNVTSNGGNSPASAQNITNQIQDRGGMGNLADHEVLNVAHHADTTLGHVNDDTVNKLGSDAIEEIQRRGLTR